jgi:hypothetical protein
MPTADETPTLDAQPDNTLEMDTISSETQPVARTVRPRTQGVGDRTVKTCTEELDKWLDILSDALLEQKLPR